MIETYYSGTLVCTSLAAKVLVISKENYLKLKSHEYSEKLVIKQVEKKINRHLAMDLNVKPDENAKGDHTVIRRHGETDEIIKYETFQVQTNPRNPKLWQSVKRYDGPSGDEHMNKVLGKFIQAPHIHDPYCPGGIRPAMPWEIPK